MKIRSAAILLAAVQLVLVGGFTALLARDALAANLILIGFSALSWGLLFFVAVTAVEKARRGEHRLEVARPMEEHPVVYYRADGTYVDWHLRQRLDEEIARAGRYGEPFALLVIGPEPGRIATDAGRIFSAVSTTFREADLVAHLGGLRFVVLLTSTEPQGAKLAAERLLIQLPMRDVRLGLACYPEDGATWQELLVKAGATEEDLRAVAGERPNQVPSRRAA